MPGRARLRLSLVARRCAGYQWASMTFPLRRLGWLAIAPVAVSLCLASACGGDAESGSKGASGGTGSQFDTGLDGNKSLDSLTPDERQQLCDKTRELIDAALPEDKLCKLTGVMAGAFEQFGGALGAAGAPGFGGAPAAQDPQTACEEAQAACLAAPTETTSECNVPSDCTVTVAEYEACWNDLNASFGAATKVVPGCDNLTLFTLAPFLALRKRPVSCDVVQEKCPGALDDLPLQDMDVPPPAP